MRNTPTFIIRPCCLAVLTLFCLIPVGCEDPPDSEHAIQETINIYLDDLQDAVSRNNQEALEKLISDASRLRPATQSQTQSKNLMLSTAKSKLAQLQFETISVTTNTVRTKLQRAVSQATQVARLRDKASSLTDAGYFMPDNANLVQAIEYALEPLKSKFNTQLREASARISNLESQSQSSRDQASDLRETADALFEEAEQAGIRQGHNAYKSGVETMRQSQKIDLAAATIELQTHMNYTAMQEDAKAELIAIGSILAGVEYTGELLQKLRNSSIDGAASLSQLADELDYESATMMQEATDASSSLLAQWDEVTNLLQEALQASGRSRTNDRDEKQATAMWKLNLEWTLGRIQEAKRRFLMEETEALLAIIDAGIENSVSKWQSLSNATAGKVEEATISAIAAYENAKQLASNGGAKSDVQSRQLEDRISVLQGNPIHESAAPDNSYQTDPSPSTPSTSNQSGGFSSPEALISAFNQIPSPMDLDGTQSAVDFSRFYSASDEMSQKFIDFQQGMLSGIANLLTAVRSHIGEDAVTAFKSEMPAGGGGGMSITLDESSLTMTGDQEATVNEVTGKSYNLQNTSRGWMIVLTSKDEGAEMAAMMFQMLAPIIEAMNNATQQINSGQITTIDQLNNMMESAMGM
jgi:hypothetical protein